MNEIPRTIPPEVLEELGLNPEGAHFTQKASVFEEGALVVTGSCPKSKNGYICGAWLSGTVDATTLEVLAPASCPEAQTPQGRSACLFQIIP